MAKQLSENDIVVLQVVCYNPSDSQIAVLNNFYAVKTPTGSGAATTQDAADQFDTLINADYTGLMWNSAQYRGTRCRTVFPIVNPMDAWVAQTGSNGPGTAGAVALPSQTCGLLRRTSEIIGKHGEGRQYLPFPAQADNQTSGKPTTGYQTRMDGLGSRICAPWTLIGTGTKQFTMRPCFFAPPDQPGTEITGYLLTQDWATQKRRGAYGRANLSPI